MLNDAKSNSQILLLTSPVRYLKGVGPTKADRLALLGIHTVSDLITRAPREWQDRRLPNNQNGGEKKAYLCQILDIKENFIPHAHLAIFKAKARILGNPPITYHLSPILQLVWIRRTNGRWDVLKSIREEVGRGSSLLVYGKKNQKGQAEVIEIEVEDWQKIENLQTAPPPSPHWHRLVPLYPATDGLSQRQLRELRWATIPIWQKEHPAWSWRENLGFEAQALGLLNIREAFQLIHFPSDEKELKAARDTLAFWEFFVLSLAMESRREKAKNIKKPHSYPNADEPKTFQNLLEAQDIQLTKGQNQAVANVLNDLAGPTPMNRLLQGEVGSGKTLVATAAILKAAEAGYQTLVLAPTEVLAFQHYLTFKDTLEPLSIKTAFLTSDTPLKQRRQTLENIREGKTAVVLGTHVLLDSEIQFKKLALVVIDEQHRFGVKQRWTVRSKGCQPDLLVLSATPIPRTLALALYGDLDISTIEELPLGRQLPKTLLLKDENEAFDIAKQELKSGNSLYVVVPAIEDYPESFYNIKKMEASVSRIFPDEHMVVLHGKMKTAQKEAAFSAFKEGQANIMLATTIIEVGIGLPKANTMIVLGAEHFGLATLHQLRGRLSRSRSQGVCVLIPSANFAAFQDDLLTPAQAWERLELFAKTKSGFEIGELDLKLRGPGELVGLEQHGEFKFSHFRFDEHMASIEPARALAKKLIFEDSDLKSYPYLKRELEENFGQSFFASDLS